MDKVNIFEEVALQSSRTIEPERIRHLASILKNSLIDSDYNYDRYNKLLRLINEISEIELLVVKYYALSEYTEEWKKYKEKHSEILSVKPIHMQSTENEVVENAYATLNKNHLVRLGLLEFKYKKEKKDKPPEFDYKTGTIKSNGYKITKIGKEILRVIDEYQEAKESNNVQ